jgi:hypothetical protein
MAEDPGFMIDGRFYAFPQSYTLGDSLLIRRLTGLTMTQFGDLLGDGDGTDDPGAIAGLVGVAVWHANPRWDIERVQRFVLAIDMASLQVQAPEDEPDPPAVGGAEAAPSPSSPEPSTSEAADSGSPALSVTGSPV